MKFWEAYEHSKRFGGKIRHGDSCKVSYEVKNGKLWRHLDDCIYCDGLYGVETSGGLDRDDWTIVLENKKPREFWIWDVVEFPEMPLSSRFIELAKPLPSWRNSYIHVQEVLPTRQSDKLDKKSRNCLDGDLMYAPTKLEWVQKQLDRAEDVLRFYTQYCNWKDWDVETSKIIREDCGKRARKYFENKA